MIKRSITPNLSLILLGLLSLYLLSGCATATIINKIPAPQTETSKQAQIKVCRQRIFMGDATSTITSLDRKPIIRSAPGICFSAIVDTGTHVLSVMAKGWLGPEIGEREFALQEGQTKYFKFKLEEIDEISENEYSEFTGYEQIIVQ